MCKVCVLVRVCVCVYLYLYLCSRVRVRVLDLIAHRVGFIRRKNEAIEVWADTIVIVRACLRARARFDFSQGGFWFDA